MYESFGDAPTPDASHKPFVSIAEISTSPQPSPNTEKPVMAMSAKMKVKSPLAPAQATNGEAPRQAGFKPTTAESDIDTQALVEMEDED